MTCIMTISAMDTSALGETTVQSRVTHKNCLHLQSKSRLEVELERERAVMLGLEQNNIEEKPWYLRGEAQTQDRPEDSVLQQQLEYDIAARQSKSLVPYHKIFHQPFRDFCTFSPFHAACDVSHPAFSQQNQ